MSRTSADSTTRRRKRGLPELAGAAVTSPSWPGPPGMSIRAANAGVREDLRSGYVTERVANVLPDLPSGAGPI